MKVFVISLLICFFVSVTTGHQPHHHHHKHKKATTNPKPCAGCGGGGVKCPKDLSCGENEHYVACPAYCTFDATCDAVFFNVGVQTCTPAAQPTGWTCTPRCECKPGFVKKYGKCVSQNCCCGENQELVPCNTPCSVNCQGVLQPCLQGCSGKACRCKVGFVVGPTGKCVEATHCASPPPVTTTPTTQAPLTCSGNAELPTVNQCTNGCTPAPTCDSIVQPPVATLSYTPRCECKPNTVRKVPGGPCIPIDECCGPEMEAKSCTENHIEKICTGGSLSVNNKAIACLSNPPPTYACVCIPARARDATTGKCVQTSCKV